MNEQENGRPKYFPRAIYLEEELKTPTVTFTN